MDVRVKPEHDIEKKPEDDNYLLVIPVLDTGICKEDPRVKPEGDCSKKEPEHDYKEKEAQI